MLHHVYQKAFNTIEQTISVSISHHHQTATQLHHFLKPRIWHQRTRFKWEGKNLVDGIGLERYLARNDSELLDPECVRGLTYRTIWDRMIWGEVFDAQGEKERGEN